MSVAGHAGRTGVPIGGGGPRLMETTEGLLERLPWLDSISDWLEPKLKSAARALGPFSTPTLNFLYGVWLGHPLHPVLTDIPIGAWSLATILDLSAAASGDRGLERAADTSVAVGVAGATAAALAGLADWMHTYGVVRRVGITHALLNTVGLGMMTTSLVWRRQPRTRARGVALSTTAMGVMLVGAYLGGELVYRLGRSINRNAWKSGPKDFTAVASIEEMEENKPKVVRHEGMDVLLLRRGTRIYAFGATCSHEGGPLAKGRFDETTVTCPWHASKFRLDDGTVVAGPASMPQPLFEVREQNGMVELRRESNIP